MAVAAPPVARNAAKSGGPQARAGKKQEQPKPPVRTKLKIGAANDPLERDADAAADKVMRAPVPSFPLAGPPDKKEKVRRKTEKTKQQTAPSAQRAGTPGRKPDEADKQATARRAATKKGGAEDQPKARRAAATIGKSKDEPS